MALKALLRRSSPSPTVNDGINTLRGENPQGSPALAVRPLRKAAKQLFALVRRTAGKPKPAAAASDATTATLGGEDPEGTLSDARVAASTVPSAHPSPVLTLVEPAQCNGQIVATSPTASVVEEAPVPSGQTGEPATSTRSAGQKSNTKVRPTFLPSRMPYLNEWQTSFFLSELGTVCRLAALGEAI